MRRCPKCRKPMAMVRTDTEDPPPFHNIAGWMMVVYMCDTHGSQEAVPESELPEDQTQIPWL